MRWLRRKKATPEYPAGTCTSWVYGIAPWVPRGWGDALQWPASAHAAGLVVCDVPVKNSIAVWPQGKAFGPYGHVAVVVEVDGDGVFTVWEPNPDGPNRTRDVRHGPYPGPWFIHPPGYPYRRLPDGAAGAGRGAVDDPIVDVVRAWDGVAYYWNVTAPLQAIRGGVIAGMLSGLF